MNPKVILATLLAMPLIAMAGVNPNNGGFFITYADVDTGVFKFDRTYQSTATEVGWFGYGWGSTFETRLIVMPDGAAAVREHGTGVFIFFHSEGGADIQRGVSRIVEAAVQQDKLSTAAAEALRRQLAGDEALRARKTLQYGIHEVLRSYSRLQSNECSAATLVRADRGYIRTACNGTIEYFDQQGHLIRIAASAGEGRININYDGGRPSSISDSAGNRISLKWTPAGLLAEAANDQHTIRYTQDKNNNLITSNDVNGNRYDYEYDANHNMTRIGYIDKSSMSIKYFNPAYGMVGTITERDGKQTFYEYTTGSQAVAKITYGCASCAQIGQNRKSTALISKSNHQKIELTVLTEEEAASAFTELASREDIPYAYAEDGSFARAHKMVVLLEKKDIIAGKAFIEGELYVETQFGEAEWAYHVAPVVMVKIGNKVQPTVFDPTFFNKPVPYEEWKKTIMKNSDSSVSREYYTNRFAYDPEDREAQYTDYQKEDLLDMNLTNRENRRALMKKEKQE